MGPDASSPRKLLQPAKAKPQLSSLISSQPPLALDPEITPPASLKNAGCRTHLLRLWQPRSEESLAHFPLPGLCSATGILSYTQPQLSASKSLAQFSLFWLKGWQLISVSQQDAQQFSGENT